MSIQRKKLNNPAYIKTPTRTDDRGNVTYRVFDAIKGSLDSSDRIIKGWAKAKYNENDNVIEYEDYLGAKVEVEYDDEDNIIEYEDNLGNYWNVEMDLPFPFIMHIPEQL